MITRIAIENFKGISDRVELELRPITLLFGANSAGKSTILHALHYAREVFERQNLDADKTTTGGPFVDLGGFRNFLHQNKARHSDNSGESGVSRDDREVRIAITIALSDTDLPEYRHPDDYNPYDELESLFAGIEEATVEVVIAWSNHLNAPHINEYSVSYNGRLLGTIVSQPGRRAPVLETLDLSHPILTKRRDLERFVKWESWTPDEQDDGSYSGLLYLLNKVRRNAWVPVWEDDTARILETLSHQRDALPVWERRLPLSDWRDDGVSDEPVDPPDREELESDNRETNAVLSRLIVGPGELVRNALKKFRYLGPVRETPPREFTPPRFPEPARWASGLGAWDALHNGTDQFVDRVGEWLGDPDNLNAGCRVERRTYLELDLADSVVRKLIDRRAFDDVEEDEGIDLTKVPTISRIVIVPTDSDIELRPHDVGVGISQVVPVIVTALDGDERLLAIEQPELHIHPRLQAEIADLFIEASQSNKHRFLLETHSEHLILRLLRRIRETEKGTVEAHRQLRTHDLAVYYIRQEDGCSTVSRIDVDVKGEFIQPWPDDFFEIDFYERFS